MPDLEALRDSAFWSALASHRASLGFAIILVAFVESFAIAGVVVPGVVLLAACAFLAGGGAMSPWSALGCAWLGAVLGDGISFWLGHHYRDRTRRLWPLRNQPQWVERGERFFNRHGAASIVAGRFIGPIRPIMPLIAGMLRMRPQVFYPVNLTSAVAWAPVYILPGYLAGASIAHPVEPPRGLIPGLIIIALGAWLLTQAAQRAWRAGACDGALAGVLSSRAAGAWLLAPIGGGQNAETRLSLVAALAVLALGAGAALVLVATLPALASWRQFALGLWRVFNQLA